MSVYTVIDRDELVAFLQTYPVGELLDFEGISDGIENTNYFVSTDDGRFVLTIFEAHAADELGYFLDLMAFLAEHQVPSAHPLADNHGQYLRELKGKPAALVQRLDGRSIVDVNADQCAQLGAALGRLHAVSQVFPQDRKNTRGPSWWKQTVTKLESHIPAEDYVVIEKEVEFQSAYRFKDLPRGVIHADLFRDNALWSNGRLTGIIDFYYAFNGALLFDVAVTVNDWCSLADGGIDTDRLSPLMHAYREQRPFDPVERGGWPVMLRAAALRFWLSRLHDLHFPRPGEITHTKDPDVFKRILLHRIEEHDRIQAMWE